MRVLFAEIIALPVDDQIMGDIPHDELRHEVACFRFVCLAASVVIDEAVRSRICRGGSAVEGDAAAENLQTAIRLDCRLAADGEGCRPAVAFNGQSGIAFRGDACAGLRRDGVGSAYADQRVDLLGCSDTGWIGNSDRPAFIIVQGQHEQRLVVAVQERIGFPAVSGHGSCADGVSFAVDGEGVLAGLRAVLLPTARRARRAGYATPERPRRWRRSCQCRRALCSSSGTSSRFRTGSSFHLQYMYRPAATRPSRNRTSRRWHRRSGRSPRRYIRRGTRSGASARAFSARRAAA